MFFYTRGILVLLVIGSYVWCLVALWRFPKDLNEMIGLLRVETKNPERRNLEIISLSFFWLTTAILFAFVVLPTASMLLSTPSILGWWRGE